MDLARKASYLEFSLPADQARDFSMVKLRATWDGRAEPSIDAPISLFYGAGTLYNRDKREYLVKSFPNVIRYADSRVYLQCYFPMPFFRSAKIEIGGASKDLTGIQWKVRHAPFKDAPNQVGYFHATHRSHPAPEAGHDMVLLDTTKVEGGGDWSGSFVGTSFIFSREAVLTRYLSSRFGVPKHIAVTCRQRSNRPTQYWLIRSNLIERNCLLKLPYAPLKFRIMDGDFIVEDLQRIPQDGCSPQIVQTSKL